MVTVSYTDDRLEYDRQKYYEYRWRNMLYVTGGATPECVKCGSKDNLEFDHIDPEKKSFDVCTRKSLKNPEYRAELEKCQLLCRECHEDKTSVENTGFTHGTMTGFQKAKCECDECEKAKAAYYVVRNAKRRSEYGAESRGVRGTYGRPSTHGERLHYTRGCRCDECRDANAAHARMLKERKALTGA